MRKHQVLRLQILISVFCLFTSCNAFYHSWIEEKGKTSLQPPDAPPIAPAPPVISSGTLLKAINQIESGSSPSIASTIGSKTLIIANSLEYGSEMWVYDSILKTTTLLQDFNPGSESSSVTVYFQWNGFVFFTANTGDPLTSGLWRTDGTPAGTIFLNTVGSIALPSPNVFERDGIWELNGYGYFVGLIGSAYRLFRTDGSPGGTQMVHSQLDWVAIFGVINGRLVFRGDSPALGAEIYSTDGTEIGTSLVKEIVPGAGYGTYAGYSDDFIVRDNILYLISSNSRIWKSDGTDPGTSQYSTTYPYGFVAFDNKVYISSSSNLLELDPNGSPVIVHGADPLSFGFYTSTSNSGNSLFYYANDGTGMGLYELRAGVGVSKIMDLNSTSTSGFESNQGLPTPFGANGVLFCANADGLGWEPFYYQFGSAPSRLADISPGAGSSCYYNYAAPFEFSVSGSIAIFNPQSTIYGIELWKTDGTVNGTSLIKDVRTSGTDGSLAVDLQPLGNGDLLFVANDGNIGSEVWITSGTGATTNPVHNIHTGASGSNPQSLIVIDNHLYFSANDGVHGQELWRTDGTEDGTELVQDVRAGLPSSSPGEFVALGDKLIFLNWNGLNVIDSAGGSIQNLTAPGYTDFGDGLITALTVVDDHVYFVADTAETGFELFRTDGTTVGTQLVADTNPGTSNGFDWDGTLHAATNGLIFNRETGDWEAWFSDGTSLGTQKIRPDVHYTYGYFEFNGYTYFQGSTFATGYELFKTDGTLPNTVLVKDFDPGTPSSNVKSIGIVGNYLLLSVTIGSDTELWRTDGTEVGTIFLQAVDPGDKAIQINGTKAIFAGTTAANGTELWETDGTTMNTRILREIRPGADSSEISELALIDNKVYFAANDGVSGNEVWSTDGTLQNTVMIADIREGVDDSNPRNFIKFKDHVFFVANDGPNGTNLHKISLGN